MKRNFAITYSSLTNTNVFPNKRRISVNKSLYQQNH